MVRRILPLIFLVSFPAFAEDWKMGGRAQDRNPVSPEEGAPTEWKIKEDGQESTNIRWTAEVGSHAYGGPVVANGLVWVGTDNHHPRDPALDDDRAVLACFRESDGKFLYQYSAPRLVNYNNDWPHSGFCASPVVEGDRIWFVNNRREVVCLDAGPLKRGPGQAKEIWKFDLIQELGVFPYSPMINSHNNLGSPAVYKNLLFVPTGNGVDVDHRDIKNPDAPCIVCFDKNTGKLVWKDNSPGKQGEGGHTASPLVVEKDGRAQVIQPQADGWVRSYEAETGKPIWKFDINPKNSAWKRLRKRGVPDKRIAVATPVYADGKVYFAAGREPEFNFTPGCLFCIDPFKAGDISRELPDGPGKGKANPNSGIVWEFARDGPKDSDILYTTVACVAVHAGFVIAWDSGGYVHCIDAMTGKRYWTFETLGGHHGGDPLIVDGKIYIGDDDGDLYVLELSKELKGIAKIEMGPPIYASPVFANGVLYVQTTNRIRAIAGNR